MSEWSHAGGLLVTTNAVDEFIERWERAGGTERANCQLFLSELCRLLELPQPEPAGDDTRDNAYVFERRVVINQPDGTSNNGFIDLYRRGSFVCEAKQSGKTLDTRGWDKAMLRAHNQADQYVRALPADEGRPPFIIVTDVGRNIELYAEFSRSGATYTPFPDPRSHRIRLQDLRSEEVRECLKAVWLDPLSLDPSRRSAQVTREIADKLAKLARSLEAEGHAPQDVAGFLMRALFTMFAEDVGLLPDHAFHELLHSLRDGPASFAPMLESLWQTMNAGGFSPVLRKTVLRFNGGLFSDSRAIPLNRAQFELLLEASAADWRYVEPAIFGTLLERALDPRERHKLGAHYTPRAYVERLVLPTVLEPLREEWQEVQAAALAYEQQGKRKKAIEEVAAFQRHLCTVTVLDPACGSGNFLYVTLEHMKRLEGEVMNLLGDLGVSSMFETEGVTVDPHQFLGLEINPRAAKIAEMVLWIGYLQWHFRTHGTVNPPEPVLRDFKNIENCDALIAYDGVEPVLDESGDVVTRWDGGTHKTSPVTGEDIPDESARTPVYRYLNPVKAEWPQADYIVGNPPFIGKGKLRLALGDGYVSAVRSSWREVPDSADFVMYWWHIAALAVRNGCSERFGLITTNSVKQIFNRRVVEHHLESGALALAFAIPDHPWIDATDGAAVRIAMTVAAKKVENGRLLQVTEERETDREEIDVDLKESSGKISSGLRVGANVASSLSLKANSGMTSMGVMLAGAGFIITPDRAALLGLGTIDGLENHIRLYRNYKDLTDRPRGKMVIDFAGRTADEIRRLYPAAYQWLLENVKPTRDSNGDKSFREKWWLFGRTRPALRRLVRGLPRYICTGETGKHRHFHFLDNSILPDHRLIAFGLDGGFHLGVLSSRLHSAWSLAAGGTLTDRPVYNKSVCFDTFPFPNASPEQQARIADLAERMDEHRKRQQEQHQTLTLTKLYNVLEQLRSGEVLTDKERVIHEQGIISVLRELHDDLDRAVFAAYGWEDLAAKLVGLPGATMPLADKPEAQVEAEEELLHRLVALNLQRAAEEANGHIRWLRPEFQSPGQTQSQHQAEANLVVEDDASVASLADTRKQAWPNSMREQVAAVRGALARQQLAPPGIAAYFKGARLKSVQGVLEALEELGLVEHQDGLYRLSA